MADTESMSATLIAEDDEAKLCDECKELDLGVHKFVISASRGISRGAQRAGNHGNGDSSGIRSVQMNSGNIRSVFATYGKVQERSEECQFCGLARRAVERYSAGDRVDSSTDLLLTWEVDGRQRIGDNRIVNRTRRIRLSWREKSGKDQTVYLVFVAPTGARRLNSDAHGTRQEFRELVQGTYFGVIDVIDMQLKALPIVNNEPEHYVALSYVRGNSTTVGERPYITTRANVMVHIQHGGLEHAWDLLPRTIQDVILLVSRLGVRYVWIDSLCIVQDSSSSWELNAKSMHLVYGNAHFTICAADGDAETGLLALESIFRSGNRRAQPSVPPIVVSATSSRPPPTPESEPQSPFPTPARSANSSAHRDSETSSGTSQTPATANLPPLTAECLPGVRLLVSRPPEAVIQDSPWNQRGWTFQERLLSRRCLIFAEGQVYFQCRSAVISQHIFTDGGVNGWSLDWTASPLRTLGELRRRAFWFYMKCIQLYTGRSLTRPKDILTAFEGASWLLQEQMNAPLFYGLPSSHFDLALLWTPLQRLRRRKKVLHRSGSGLQCTQDEMGNCSCKHEEEGFGSKEFPSWSWCGWMGGKAEYQLSLIDGCLLNVQEWLRQHTWILWYVRDYEGNLRPLWDKQVLKEDQSAEQRWRGYAGQRGQASKSVRFPALKSSMLRHRQTSPPPAPPPHLQSSTHRRPKHLSREFITLYPPGPRSPPLRPRARSPSPPGRSHTVHISRDRSKRPPTKTSRRRVTVQTSSDQEGWTRKSNEEYLQRLPPGYYSEESRRGASRPRASAVDTDPSGASISREVEREEIIRHRHSSRRDDDDEEDRDQFVRTRTVINGDDDRASNRHTYFQSRHPVVEWAEHASDESFSEDENSSDMSQDGDSSSTETGGQMYRPGGAARKEDLYGRAIRPELAGKDATDFTGILPDNPFGVIRGTFPDDVKDHLRAMPILQFWTWRTELLVTLRRGHSSDALGTGLCHCDIVDKAGDWCGSIVLPRGWIIKREGLPLMFIALSDAKNLTQEECPAWNYYIPKEKDESEWDLFYVMLLERNQERALWERVGVGKVFQAAFGDAAWDEIKLG
ncbi:heterokaryon incompatibility protein-domain-containing protein [Apiosordaria backusii]|uniref:Heterokaryon incompatibility protein-domain-containing protein n=1 Tax=Apiosordaria backusii TaxID=314023 RepID=A0AA40EXA6_9PEZI|nr:heterokaryon incompatibility protein-domain-containing protein [Apiosordaria backusii]